MASTILLKRSNTAGNDAYTGQLGEVTLDTQARKLRIHDGVKVGGHIVSNMTDVQAVIDQVNGLTIDDIGGLRTALDTIEADITDHETRLSAVETTYIKKDGTVAFTGAVDAGTNKVINVAEPTATTDAANKGYVDTEISALGDVFSYEGTVSGGTQAQPTDLNTLGDTTAGSYYSVDTAGYVTYNTATEYVNTNDAILFNASGGYKIIDNTNSEINGTLDFVDVSGSPDTGYTVNLSNAFKSRVNDLETDIVLKAYKANPAFTGAITHDGTMVINTATTIATGDALADVFSITDTENVPLFEVRENGDVVIGGTMTVNGTGTSTFAGDVSIGGAITVSDGATVNADFTADDMTLTGNLNVKGNTTLGDASTDTVSINGTATAITQAVNDNSTKLATTAYTKNMLESGTYTIDGGTF